MSTLRLRIVWLVSRLLPAKVPDRQSRTATTVTFAFVDLTDAPAIEAKSIRSAKLGPPDRVDLPI